MFRLSAFEEGLRFVCTKKVVNYGDVEVCTHARHSKILSARNPGMRVFRSERFVFCFSRGEQSNRIKARRLGLFAKDLPPGFLCIYCC